MAKRKMARNALKGYTFQNYIFTLFLAKMDAEREIILIESETLNTKNFDDICVVMKDGLIYRVQAKNYPGTKIEDISVSEYIVRIKTNDNHYDSDDNNVVIINTDQIATNTVFMGMPAVIKKGITIVPLTEEQVTERLDDLYRTEDRELQIIQKAYEYTCMEKFEVHLNDLPDLIKLSTDLKQQTVIMRVLPEKIEHGITFFVGKPGVGKSHFVNELISAYPDAIVYRFWIGPQDEQLTRRLQFDKFLTEIGILIYKSPRDFTIEELIGEIVTKDRIIIVDGLDHVENYNPLELQKYVDFISTLGDASARVIVLSRPLKMNITWSMMELLNWNIDETRLYLQVAHDISDYGIQKSIFTITDGYPIITYFLAEHYKQHGNINIKLPVADLNQYYDSLLSKVETKSLLCIFATNNSFFTWKELSILLSEPELYAGLNEFVDSYPYLFERLENRISLIHDSLNTYLRGILSSFPIRQEKVMSVVKSSIKDGNIEYMSRLASFNLDDDFLTSLLKKYSNFNVFKQLLNSTLDYNSITNFYKQLQRILETREGVLDIYQYYSFGLIFQVATRNDLIGYDGLIYQILLYIHNGEEKIENQIFSSGIIWNVYLACRKMEHHTEKFIKNSRYSDQQFYELINSVNQEASFYDQLSRKTLFSEIEPILLDSGAYLQKKEDLIEEYLVSVWISGSSEDTFYDLFMEYINTENETIFSGVFEKYGMDNFWTKLILHRAKIRLHELGYFEDENVYRGRSLIEKINEFSSEGSFSVAPVAQSLIRLANYENREIDIYSVNYVWAMYGQRKDYSVSSIEDALIIFEEKELIEEKESIELIHRLMAQSEKGIRHLMSSYINKKGPECTKRLIDQRYFNSSDFEADIFDLLPDNINCFTSQHIALKIKQMLYYHRYGKSVEYSDLYNVLESDYCDMVLDALDAFKYSISGVIEGDAIENKLIEHGIKYFSENAEKEKKYVPFNGGYIHEEDESYIRENDIKALEVAKYTDGWYSCLPFPEIYKSYNNDDLRRDHIEIIHKSLFARISDKEYIGDWNLLIGNIPEFLKICEIELEWEKIFEIFKQFLETSSIYFPQKQNS